MEPVGECHKRFEFRNDVLLRDKSLLTFVYTLPSPSSIYFPPKQATLFQRAALRAADGAQPVPTQLDLSCERSATRQLEFGGNASVRRACDSPRATN